MRRYPRIFGPAVLPLFCLAPHGVFPASRITPRAVSSYLAFSTLPCTSLPKNRRCLFCDTFRRRNLAIAAPACFTRHAAVWCSDFPPASLAAHQRSSAIARILTQTRGKESGRTADFADETHANPRYLRLIFLPLSRVRTVERIKPVGQEELFLCRKERRRRRNDWPQRGGHLQTYDHKDDSPELQMGPGRTA
jgi:hypothetical protein